MKTLFTPLMILINCIVFSQAPNIDWQIILGSDNFEGLSNIFQTSDGGYIVSSTSNGSISGDKTEASKGFSDYWVIKIDDLGNVEWDKTIGGNSSDNIKEAIQTTDNGFFLAGFSLSNISGDKTENTNGSLDLWVVKLNATGAILWQNTIGGLFDESLRSVKETSDGGFILGGSSASNISGDKTENSLGGTDYWVVKLNSLGVIEWDNTIGGSSGDEAVNSIIQTSDGGYVVGGFSSSPISGDKTEAQVGGRDYWIVKLASNGVVQWDKTLGGNQTDVLKDIVELNDGSLVLTGYSSSDVSGDKTDPSNGETDYWVVKLSSDGQTIIWQNSIGGALSEFADNISLLPNGDFILGGNSSSEPSGDKTEAVRDSNDIWSVKISALGQVLWDKTVGCMNDNDEPSRVFPTSDNGYILGVSASAPIFGDKTILGYNNGFDAWIIKLEPETLSIPEIDLKDISIYPNPTSNSFTLDLNKKFAHLRVSVTDLLGRTIRSYQSENHSRMTINLDAEAGIYLINIYVNDTFVLSKKIIKK